LSSDLWSHPGGSGPLFFHHAHASGNRGLPRRRRGTGLPSGIPPDPASLPAGLSPALLSADNVLPSGRVIGSSKGRRYCPSRRVHKPADESSSLTASVSIAAWPALCGHNNAGEFEGSVPKTAPPGDHIPLGGVVRSPTNFPHPIKLREGVSWFILFS